MRISRTALMESAIDTIHLMRQYKLREHRGERRGDAVLFGLLEGRFGKIDRQHSVPIGHERRLKRIDFRQRGQRPVLIEFAVATDDRASLLGGPNRSELIKLERAPSRHSRFLLLLDMTRRDPLERSNLKESYDRVHGGRGNYRRSVVNVIYAHEDAKPFWFQWWP